MVQDVDPGPRVEGREEHDGTKHSPMKLARTPNTDRKRENGGRNPGKGAEFVTAHAAQ
jgi:hypothetical protein